MTKQEIFDKVVKHFSIQRQAAGRGVMLCCMYRTPDGRKCAVGALIPDEAYDPSCEGEGVSTLFREYPDMMRVSGLTRRHEVLLIDLQRAHDSAAESGCFLSDLSGKLRVTANTHRINSHLLVLLDEEEA